MEYENHFARISRLTLGITQQKNYVFTIWNYNIIGFVFASTFLFRLSVKHKKILKTIFVLSCALYKNKNNMYLYYFYIFSSYSFEIHYIQYELLEWLSTHAILSYFLKYQFCYLVLLYLYIRKYTKNMKYVFCWSIDLTKTTLYISIFIVCKVKVHLNNKKMCICRLSGISQFCRNLYIAVVSQISVRWLP